MKSRYVPITQQPYGCVIACLEMILARRNIPHISRDEIGTCLGLIVPEDKARDIPGARTGKKPSSGWGTQVQKEEYSIHNFFKKHKIPLEEEYFPLSKVSEVGDWIMEKLDMDDDLIVCFQYGKLYGGKDQGHVSLIESISKNSITLLDPGRSVPKFRRVPIKNLLGAIESHGKESRAGFWIIKSKK